MSLLWWIIALIQHATAALNPVDPSARGIYFVSPHTELPGQEYVVAINIVPSTGDIFIHMSADAAINSTEPAFSWMGLGFGSSMQNTFMFLAYPSNNGTGVTLSPRWASGHSEPEYMLGLVVEKIFDDEYAPHANTVGSGIMIAHGVCRNCTRLITNHVDLNNRAQPFIYALGAAPKHSNPLKSDDSGAGLRMHAFHGSFQADMAFATSSADHARVPHPNDPGGSPSGVADTNFAFAFSSAPYNTGKDSERVSVIHGVLMSMAFIVIFPLGAVLMRLLKRIGFLAHAGVQLVGMLLVLTGFGTGVYMSRRYIQTRSFSTAHQILGLLVFAALAIQMTLGVAHHRLWARWRAETKLGIVHRCLGPAIIVLGLLNGGLGLDLAGNAHFTTAYGTVAGILAALFLVAIVREVIRRRSKTYKPEHIQATQLGQHYDAGAAILDVETPASAYEMSPWRKKIEGN